MIGRLLAKARGALGRALIGVSAEEIRYTIEDVRKEIRATRTELLGEIASLRAELAASPRRDESLEDDKPVAQA